MFGELKKAVGDEDEDQSVDAAKAAELRQATIKFAFEQASTVIKAMLLFNGGALLAILSFIAQYSKSDKFFPVSLPRIVDAMAIFGAGAIAALACLFFNFMAASMHAHSQGNSGYDQSMYVRLAGVGLALMSFFLFTFGVWAAVSALG